MTEKQLEMDNLIRGNGLRYSYVARKIGITRQTLYNQLKKTVEINIEYYIKIKNFIEKNIETISVVNTKTIMENGTNIVKDSAVSYIAGRDVNQSQKEVKYLLKKVIELEETNLKLKAELAKYSST